jgi:hypothetical protein
MPPEPLLASLKLFSFNFFRRRTDMAVPFRKFSPGALVAAGVLMEEILRADLCKPADDSEDVDEEEAGAGAGGEASAKRRPELLDERSMDLGDERPAKRMREDHDI